MARILPNARRPRGCPVALCLGLFLTGGSPLASTQEEPPDGLPAGPMFFAPWFESEVLADDNIFRRSDQQQLSPLEGLEDSDIATTLRAGVTAYVPLRMSLLEFGYEGSTFTYRDSNFSGTDRHTGYATFDLNFSSYHTLRFEETYTDGHTELQREVGLNDDDVVEPELIRQGIPFSANTWALEWERDVPGRRSWRARVERDHRRYKPEDLEQLVSVPWNDHEAWDVEYEFNQPIYRRGVLTGQYTARREEQFDANLITQPFGFGFLRRVEYDALEVGYRGLIGRQQPLFVRIGYGALAFRDVQTSGPPPSNFRGLVGNATWRLPVGGLSNMSITLNRRPRSSILNTYYLIEEVRVLFDRRFREVSLWGVSLRGSSSRYGNPTSTVANESGTLTCRNANGDDIIRSDRGYQIEGFWEWYVLPRAAVRMTATSRGSDSNCVASDYQSNSIAMRFRVGWF